MIVAPLNEEIALAFVAPILLAVAHLAHSTYKRVRTYATARCIAQISSMIVAKVEPDDEEIFSIRHRYTKSVILEAILFISEHIYGSATNRLSLIVEVCGVDCYIVNMVKRSGGSNRANTISKLSILTHITMAIECAEIYIENDNREVRFFSMATLVTTRPERAIRYIAKFDSSLSLYEVAILAHLMRRAGAPIAYTPLLTSQNRNLQLIGIYISNLFSIADAEPHLQQLIESDDREVAYIALHTLCSIRGDISSQSTGYALKQLAPFQRATFIRHAVQECYSLHPCKQYLSAEEQTLFLQRLSSYKCRIACN